MYFVDRTKMENTLVYMEKQLSLLQQSELWNTDIQELALERICHTIIDCMMDIGNAIIDGFIMRDPGSYEDIIDILEDEQVITQQMSVGIKSIIPFRKMLVQSYLHVSHSELLITFKQEMPILMQFTVKVRAYLMNELGPVTAFKN